MAPAGDPSSHGRAQAKRPARVALNGRCLSGRRGALALRNQPPSPEVTAPKPAILPLGTRRRGLRALGPRARRGGEGAAWRTRKEGVREGPGRRGAAAPMLESAALFRPPPHPPPLPSGPPGPVPPSRTRISARPRLAARGPAAHRSPRPEPARPSARLAPGRYLLPAASGPTRSARAYCSAAPAPPLPRAGAATGVSGAAGGGAPPPWGREARARALSRLPAGNDPRGPASSGRLSRPLPPETHSSRAASAVLQAAGGGGGGGGGRKLEARDKGAGPGGGAEGGAPGTGPARCLSFLLC